MSAVQDDGIVPGVLDGYPRGPPDGQGDDVAPAPRQHVGVVAYQRAIWLELDLQGEGAGGTGS